MKITLAQEAKALNSNIIVVLISAFDMEEFSQARLEGHAGEFMRKPISVSSLKNMMIRHVGKAKN